MVSTSLSLPIHTLDIVLVIARLSIPLFIEQIMICSNEVFETSIINQVRGQYLNLMMKI